MNSLCMMHDFCRMSHVIISHISHQSLHSGLRKGPPHKRFPIFIATKSGNCGWSEERRTCVLPSVGSQYRFCCCWACSAAHLTLPYNSPLFFSWSRKEFSLTAVYPGSTLSDEAALVILSIDISFEKMTTPPTDAHWTAMTKAVQAISQRPDAGKSDLAWSDIQLRFKLFSLLPSLFFF